MKYAAKRTWPEKAQSWEHQGEADTIEGFATEFATVEQLPADAEFVVMTRDGASSETRFFRVASSSPCVLAPAQSRAGGEKAAPSATAAPAEDASGEVQSGEVPADMPPALNIQPVISMFWYMGKVAIIATLLIAAMIPVVAILKKALGD